MAITSSSHEYFVGNRAHVIADITFGSSYPYGGDTINTDQLFGIHTAEYVVIEPSQGYSFQYDYANDKIKAFAPAPPIVYEEKHTPSSDIVTTDYPAAFIMNVARSGNNKKLRSTGIAIASLSDDECSLVAIMAEQTRTQITVKDYDRLASDGLFTGGTTNWTLNGAGVWAYGTNNCAKGGDGTNTLAHDNFAAVVGRTYRLAYTISSWSVGTVTPTLGGTAGTAVGADGTYTEEITAATTDGLTFAGTNTSRFTIDSITIYDLSEPIYITYVTQAWKDVWDNLVQDEAITLATGANTLSTGNKIAACMYVDQTTATAAALTLLDEDDTVASGEVEVAFNAATAQLTVHSAQNAKAAKITYIKVPDSGFLVDRLFTNETATKTGSDPYLNTFAHPILLWGYSGQLPVNGGTTQRMIDAAATPGAGEFAIDWFSGTNRGVPTTPTGAGASHDHALSGATAAGASHDHALSGSTAAGSSHDHALSGATAAGSAHTHTFTGTAQAPAIVVEEAVTVTTHVGTLAHVPLYIVAVQVTAGSTTGAFSVIPTGETPLTKQVAVTFTSGVLTFLDTDAVTACKVTYIPKRGSGYLSAVTVDEVIAASDSKTNLAARAGLVQYVWDDTDGVIVALEQPGTAPSATHFCTVDINDSANTSVDSHADDATNSLKVTYVPYTQLPPGCFIDDTDITLSSEAWNFTGDPGVAGYNNLIVPGFGVNVIGETGAAARAPAIWEGPSGTAAEAVATWNPATNSILTNNDTAITILSMPWMILSPLFLTPATPAGTNANESAHTHDVGTLDAAAENAHTHAVGTLDAAAESTHTHAVGTLDAAAEATHTHAISYTTSYGTILDLKSNVTGTGAGIWGVIDEIPNLQPLEVTNGADLSGLTVKILVIGT